MGGRDKRKRRGALRNFLRFVHGTHDKPSNRCYHLRPVRARRQVVFALQERKLFLLANSACSSARGYSWARSRTNRFLSRLNFPRPQGLVEPVTRCRYLWNCHSILHRIAVKRTNVSEIQNCRLDTQKRAVVPVQRGLMEPEECAVARRRTILRWGTRNDLSMYRKRIPRLTSEFLLPKTVELPYQCYIAGTHQ